MQKSENSMMVDKTVKNLGKNRNCKIVIAGDGAVGKTTICKRVSGNLKEEEAQLMTCGIDFHNLEILNGQPVEAQLWDLGGQEQFRPFQKSFFDGAHIVIFVYSVEWFHSFINLEDWINLAKRYNPHLIYLLGNKIDCEDRAISREEATTFAEEHYMKYFEVSALDGSGFEEFKNELIVSIKEMYTD
ncbi:MAG: GTP-binding protein [Candidatus Lokiarchaeota archaeon]|nr:GTP-binding protein [Candidatus Lokiarchaeota archaeon]